jgi:hypothetical protein
MLAGCDPGRALGLAAAALAGCTTLGPMPTTTAVSAVPSARPDAELQAGIVPGYNLSSAVAESPSGDSISQLAGVLEPDRLLGLPGLLLGARLYGPEEDTALEPMLGYRRAIGADESLSLAGIAYGTHAAAAKNGASYEATRAGAELALDLRLFSRHRWVEPHVLGSVALTALWAEGTYCTDDAGQYGKDCPEPPTAPRIETARAAGAYPSITGGIALDLIRHRDSPFHGGRLVFLLSSGAMPRIIAGDQRSPTPYAAAGLLFSLAVGASR